LWLQELTIVIKLPRDGNSEFPKPGEEMMMRALSKLLAATAVFTSSAVSMADAETVKITLLGVGDVYKFEGGKLMANDVMALVKKRGTVDAKVEGRIVIK
jgi:hypothetical protein